MNSRTIVALGLVAALVGGGNACSQPGQPPTKSQQGKSKKATPRSTEIPKNIDQLVAMLAKNGIDIDLKAKTVSVDAEMGRPADPLEYVLIHPKGKTHEAMMISEVVPSLLNTALLAVGFDAGKNARVEEIKPAPTLEEVRAGAPWLIVHRPEGKAMWITVSWTHDSIEHKDVPVERLLMDMTTEQEIVDNRWVFLGGNWGPLLRGEDPVFLGDYQGNIVSACYMFPPNHLVTVDHERGNDEQNWWLMPICPPTETPMRVTFHLEKPASVIAREKELAEKAKKQPADSADAGKDADAGKGADAGKDAVEDKDRSGRR